MKKMHGPSSKQAKFGFSLIVFGVITGLAAVLLLLNNNHKAPKAPPRTLTSGSAPSSVKPSAQAVASYVVPPTNPKYITIPAIGVASARIIQLGLLSDGSIAVPSNIYDTGWYDGSAKPGQNGAMFIYGHVSSWKAKGVFYNLKKLTTGDKITVIRGDNTTYTYQVVSSKVYPFNKVPMDTVLAPARPGKPSLNLMTCTGKVIAGTSEFNERLVIFTSLVAN